MKPQTNRWLHGLLATVINGLASGIVLIIVDPMNFNFAGGFGKLCTACTALGLLGMANYLKQSPLPPEE